MSEASVLTAAAKTNGKERRRQQRWKVFEIAAVTGRSGTAACVIDNLSATGALVSADLALEIDELVSFEIDEFGPIPARVVHLRESLAGLAFEFDGGDRGLFRRWLEEVEKEGNA